MGRMGLATGFSSLGSEISLTFLGDLRLGLRDRRAGSLKFVLSIQPSRLPKHLTLAQWPPNSVHTYKFAPCLTWHTGAECILGML